MYVEICVNPFSVKHSGASCIFFLINLLVQINTEFDKMFYWYMMQQKLAWWCQIYFHATLSIHTLR